MFTFQSVSEQINGEKQTIELQMDCCVAAGYTGRDQKSVQAHIDELKKLGVAAPYNIPAMYWISPSRITNHNTIVVVGQETSPEVEFFLSTDQNNKTYMTVASDHTDRELEAVSVGKSKQVCDKVIGDVFWDVDEIKDHWDNISLGSRVIKDGDWVAYQSGTFGAILHYQELLTLIKADAPAGQRPSLLSGTLPIIGGDVVYTSSCEIFIKDPILNREITKRYNITVLPDRS